MNKRSVATSHTLRAAAVLAVVVVVSVVWVVYRTVEQAQVSDRSVLHTQEVLTSLEAVLATVLDADVAVRRFTASSDSRTLEPFDRAERAAGEGINQLATLTADNPNQQARVPELRQEIAQALAALRVVADAKRAARAVGPTDTDAAQARITAARNTIQAMRAEENRLLAARVQANHAAVRRLQQILIALVAAAVGLLGWVAWLIAGNARRQREGTDTLRRANEDLETEAGVRAADLRDSNARLRSIIDSAVDGIIVIDAKGRIEAFNRGAERLFGYPEAEVIGRNVNMLMPSPDHDEPTTAICHSISTPERRRSSAWVARSPGAVATAPRSRSTCRSARCRFRASASSPACSTISAERVRLDERAARQRGTVAVGHRFRGGRHRRHRCARAYRSVQSRRPNDCSATRSARSSAATSTS